jgi:hypothetical protein
VAALERLRSLAAAAVVEFDGVPVGAAGLAEVGGVSGTGTIDLHAWPGHEDDVRAVVVDVVVAAFEGSGIHHLYHERFDDDADLLTPFGEAWTLEVTFPEFARLGGRLADRWVFGLSRAELDAWLRTHGRADAAVDIGSSVDTR